MQSVTTRYPRKGSAENGGGIMATILLTLRLAVANICVETTQPTGGGGVRD